MLPRVRKFARRWPGLCVALLLTAFASQGMAATLAWCLHGGGQDGHVTSAVKPCHAGGQAREARHDPGAGHVHCHGEHHHAAHVAFASDAALGPATAIAAPPAPLLLSWQQLPSVVALTESKWLPAPRWRPAIAPDPRPRLSGAVPGASIRLLI